LESGSEHHVEFRINHPTRGERWLAGHGRLHRDREGRPLRMFGISHDITERKQAEQALADSLARLRLALDAGGMGVWQLDETDSVTRLDEIDARLLGLPPETRTLPMADFIARVHPDDRAEMRRRAAAARRRGSDFEHEFRVPLEDGAVRWLTTRGRTALGRDGKPLHTIGVNFDITERKRVEEHQQLLMAELDHRVKNALARVAGVVRRTRDA